MRGGDCGDKINKREHSVPPFALSGADLSSKNWVVQAPDHYQKKRVLLLEIQVNIDRNIFQTQILNVGRQIGVGFRVFCYKLVGFLQVASCLNL